MPKLLITRKLPESVMDAARERFDVEVRAETKGLSVSEARAALWVYDAIIPTLGDTFSAEAFTETPRTKILANFGVGYNHIDAKAARAVRVEVTNTPGAVTDATADIAITLMLMTCRRLVNISRGDVVDEAALGAPARSDRGGGARRLRIRAEGAGRAEEARERRAPAHIGTSALECARRWG
jgi:lactate dehydrogenase-like 2-hydroxyacid dehydrogenase